MFKKISVGKEVAINIFNTRYRAQTIFRHYRIRVKNMDPRTRLSRFVSWIGYLLRAELMVENLPANAGDARDTGSVPGLRKSPGVGNGNLLQYSCLEKFHGQRNRVGYGPQDHKKLDMIEQLSTGQEHEIKNMIAMP